MPRLVSLLLAGSLAGGLAGCSPPAPYPERSIGTATASSTVAHDAQRADTCAPPCDGSLGRAGSSNGAPVTPPPVVLTRFDTMDVPPAPLPGIRRAAVVPALYVDSGPCPGEGCHQNKPWRSRFRVELYARPDTTSGLIYVLASGVLATPSARQVHTVPAPFIARRSASIDGRQGESSVRGRHAAGDTVWVLTYRGEGHFLVMLANGAIVDDYGLGFSPSGGTAGRRCERLSKCWGILAHTLESTTWIRLRTEDGRHGWTHQMGAFEIPE